VGAQVGVAGGEAEDHGEDHHEGHDQHPQDLDHGGMAEERQDDLDGHRHEDEDDLGRRARVEAGLVTRTKEAPTMRMRPSTSKPSWVSQLKKAMTRLPFARMPHG